MRTRLTLERDVAERLKAEMSRTGKGLKATIHEALRRGLGMTAKQLCPEPFRVEPHDFGLNPGIDRDRMNQLADDLEAEEVARKLQR